MKFKVIKSVNYLDRVQVAGNIIEVDDADHARAMLSENIIEPIVTKKEDKTIYKTKDEKAPNKSSKVV